MVWGDNLDVENLEYQPGDFLEIYFTLCMETVYIRSNDTQSKVKKVLVFSLNRTLLQTIDNLHTSNF